MEILNSILTWHLIGYDVGVCLMLLQTRLYFLSYSFYWHNSASHKHYTIVPWFQHVVRFWQWINSTIWYQGHLTKFTAEHRIHHIYSDTDRDPFSPSRFTLKQLWTYEQRPGAARYISPEDIEKYGDPSVEPNDPATIFYKKHQFRGVWISTLIWTIILGPLGFVLGYLMPYFHQYYGTFIGDWFWHKIGYKHPSVKGEARNFLPIWFGEALHSNHHAYPNRINKAVRWFEFDLLYWVLILLSWINIIKFNKHLEINSEMK
jgi:stearoyl-CoA desaturase (Delta-9 desaturase)